MNTTAFFIAFIIHGDRILPQIAKGGKYIFGWSKVGENGRIVVPPEAIDEYMLKGQHKAFLIPGSKQSGGFGLSTPELLGESPIAIDLLELIQQRKGSISEGEVVVTGRKSYCWVIIKDDGSFQVPVNTLEDVYGIYPGNVLLVIRGSRFAIGFALKGPIVKAAINHSEIKLFE